MTVKGVLLDLDGTFVLSNDAHAEFWVEAFSEFGYSVSFDQVRPLIGMGGSVNSQSYPGDGWENW